MTEKGFTLLNKIKAATKEAIFFQGRSNYFTVCSHI